MLTLIQTRFGLPINAIGKIIEAGYLPESYRTFIQKFKATWDIETLEESSYQENDENAATVTNAIHKVVSLGVSSNLPDFENRFFCRSSSVQEDGEVMIGEFMGHLFKMAEKLQELLPDEIVAAAEFLGVRLKGQEFSKEMCTERTLFNHLKNYRKLSVYGFNSGKIELFKLKQVLIFIFQARFDVPVVIGMISRWCREQSCKIEVIKKGSGYMTLNVKRGDLEVVFKDVRHYTSPCNLDKFLKTWEAPADKSIFPYQRFGSIEELEQTTDFPPIEDFFSDLKQVISIENKRSLNFIQETCDQESYDEAKAIYETRKRLPDSDPQKMRNMKDWLEFYQMLDTMPLVHALDTCFSKFHELFNIDPILKLSLPSIAYE